MAAKTSGSMEDKLSTPELNTPLKLTRINKMPDGPVDMATVSSTVVQNLAKRKAIKRGAASHSVTSDSVDDSKESDKITEGVDLRPRFEIEASLLEEQCRAKAREKMVAVMDDEFKKVDCAGKEGFPARGGEKPVGRKPDSGVGSFLVGAGERKGSSCPKAEGRKLYQLRYTKAEIMAFSEGNYEEKEIMDEEEVEEMEVGLNVAEKTAVNNQEIESSRLRVVDLEGLLEVEKKSSAELQKELDVARGREELTLLYSVEYADEYKALISQYEDQLDDNMKLSSKLKEAKRQVEDKTATNSSRDSTLSQFTSELVELKEKAASGSRHGADLA
ncbi:hypothetical protein GIB67_013930 [Kingdonia uniflora]|uniref:Uncharacterized protein n=1 Tax=Kingdonia uniflora TaxID=39325 RepID=A0A7J7LDD4_9MAGN|nr:hypothetical protein GIB67_013930 [Kingdonia uniflora]